jgi:di/tricarboxylate transporter
VNLAVLSVVGFALAIIISCISRINVGFLAITFALVIGVLLGGMPARDVMAGFPGTLFVTLIGVTLFFSQATVNGTLDEITRRSVQIARGNTGFIPIIFFVLAAALSSIGPGAIATAALLAPVAMKIAGRAGVPAFLMAIVVCCGANAGTLSPIASSGIIANGLLERIGIVGQERSTYLNNLYVESIVGLGGYFLLGGYKLFGRRAQAANATDALAVKKPLTWQQKLTVTLLALMIAAVVVFQIDVAMGAFMAAAILTLARASDEEAAIKAIPWNVIVMVSGVIVLVSILERNGGLDLFTTILARFATQQSITGIIAFVTGLISTYSSSAGVVMPSFIPTIPGLIQKLGGGDPIAIAASINVGAFITDTSPLSTLGALCIANAAATEDRRILFNKMMAWGLSMSVVGAFVCWIFFGLLW